jgi:hypothetical protein
MTADQRAALLALAAALLRTHLAAYRRDPARLVRELLPARRRDADQRLNHENRHLSS